MGQSGHEDKRAEKLNLEQIEEDLTEQNYLKQVIGPTKTISAGLTLAMNSTLVRNVAGFVCVLLVCWFVCLCARLKKVQYLLALLCFVFCCCGV